MGVNGKCFWKIDFDSDEALYVQLKNQIILGIANEQIREGEMLPSVRELAEDIGINMHTVNKAYSALKREGYLKVDRRGAVIALDLDKYRAKAEMEDAMEVILAQGICKGVTCEEVHQLIDRIFEKFRN